MAGRAARGALRRGSGVLFLVTALGLAGLVGPDAARAAGETLLSWPALASPPASPGEAAAPDPAASPETPDAPAPGEPFSELSFFVTPKLERLVHSHTSYEFGNPLDANLNPLSRLEFPLNSWWGGAELGLGTPRWRLDLAFLTSFPGQDNIGPMRDSDWEDSESPGVRTIYSETQTKLKESYNLDAKLSVSLRDEISPWAWLDIRPLVGFRWQKLVFLTHDGMQQSLDFDPDSEDYGTWTYDPLTGETLWFRQEYWHAYLGLQLVADLARLGLGEPGQGWQVSLTGDVARVWGENLDRHLLRGDRETRESTKGYGLHTALALRAPLTAWAALVLSAEYLYIDTQGDHTLRDFGEDIITFDYGVRVWSQQAGVTMGVEFSF
ncbi:MAG: omptin family outer membrane protease [Deltaproteobacteria bacterium]|nr:omptin family outer membrane protease [Deltaproteobacteria bacterium]